MSMPVNIDISEAIVGFIVSYNLTAFNIGFFDTIPPIVRGNPFQSMNIFILAPWIHNYVQLSIIQDHLVFILIKQPL
jgi:hypothetical protein